MANEGNLRSLGDLTTSEQREIAKKGARASAKVRRKKKKMREDLQELLALPDEDLAEKTGQQAMLVAMLKKAKAGDVAAATFIRDTIGEKPTDKVDKNLTGGFSISWQN